jgi:L-lactate dehydrogenase complex protein LldE
MFATISATRAGVMAERAPHVALFVSCLVDLFRPTVGFAAARLLEQAGCRVSAPRAQTCCGQPAYNGGDRSTAADIARSVIATFAGFDYVVVPSGSCAGMIKRHYPALFGPDPAMRARAEELAGRTFELVSFLVDVVRWDRCEVAYRHRVAYHDACSGLRELGVRDQPRRLLGGAAGLELRELAEPETCCGFGGTFCVKYPDISDAMVARKVDDIVASGADVVLAGDLGCLMNIAGKLGRSGSAIEVRHIAEVLAGMAEGPAIGAPRR